ncbi:DNA-binding protein c1d [Sparganum proliferum]
MSEDSLFDSIPSEVSQHLVKFSEAIQDSWDIIATYRESIKGEKSELSVMQRIQTDLSMAYAINALCNGVEVKDHPILKELERITACLRRCQNLCEKQSSKRLHLDKQATTRFVRNALWQSAQSKTKKRRMESESTGQT